MWEKAIQTRILSKLISSFRLFVYFFKPGVSNFTDLRTKLGIADVVSCSQILNLSADFKRTTALKKKKKKKNQGYLLCTPRCKRKSLGSKEMVRVCTIGM